MISTVVEGGARSNIWLTYSGGSGDEYLSLLQERQKWLKQQRNLQVGDIVMVLDNQRNAWTMARVLEVIKDKKGLVRIVHIKTPTGTLTRPIHKLSLLLECDVH